MLRPIDASALLDPQTRPTARAPASGTADPAALAVAQAAVVALGTAPQPHGDAQASPATYKRSATPSPDIALAGVAVKQSSPTETTTAVKPAPAAESMGAQQAANAQGVSPDVAMAAAGSTKLVRSADGVVYAVSGQVLVNPGAISNDPEVAIRELTELQQAALTPPTTLNDLQLAARAALDVQRAQLELARRKYTQESPREPSPQAAAPAPSTDIKA